MAAGGEILTSTATTDDEFPHVVIETNSQTEYTRGKFLGKLEDEINIHRTLCHKNVVRFHSHFEDAQNVYIILELCTRQPLEELHKYRETLTEPEVRHMLRQLLLACEYLVQEQVIHRDLKLGNLLLTKGSQLKVADIGLATRVLYPGKLMTSICGTTNYMAPEMLTLKGYSYAADTWAVGCIMYKLLVGRAPFKSTTKAETLTRIKRNKFEIPPTVSPEAAALIRWILEPEPATRPSIGAIMHHEFMIRDPTSSGTAADTPETASCVLQQMCDDRDVDDDYFTTDAENFQSAQQTPSSKVTTDVQEETEEHEPHLQLK
ncbi:serine/threonine-protein kinase PLK1-like [Amblyomma americanum]